MANLYELTSDLIALSEIDEVEEVEQIKAIIEAEIENKSTGIVAVVRNLESTVDAIDTEINRLQHMKKIKENNITRLRDYTKECMELRGAKKIETSLGNISIRKTPPKVVITDEDRLPIKYIVEEVVTKIDKKAILSDMKELGITEGSGARLECGTTLLIR